MNNSLEINKNLYKHVSLAVTVTASGHDDSDNPDNSSMLGGRRGGGGVRERGGGGEGKGRDRS